MWSENICTRCGQDTIGYWTWVCSSISSIFTDNEGLEAETVVCKGILGIELQTEVQSPNHSVDESL